MAQDRRRSVTDLKTKN